MMIYQSTYSSHASVSGYSLTDTECVEQSCQMTKHIPMARDVSRALTVYRYPAVNKLTTTTHIHTERERRTQTHRQTDRQTLIESMTSCPLKGKSSPFLHSLPLPLLVALTVPLLRPILSPLTVTKQLSLLNPSRVLLGKGKGGGFV